MSMLFLRRFMPAFCAAGCVSLVSMAAEPVDIGSHRELFVDDHVIEKIEGDARLELQQPVPRDVALVTGKPWEGNTCAYYTVFRDGDICRMYYRGANYDLEKRDQTHRQVTCYAESKDGIHWTKPNLGLVEFEGSKENNIVWNGAGAVPHDVVLCRALEFEQPQIRPRPVDAVFALGVAGHLAVRLVANLPVVA